MMTKASVMKPNSPLKLFLMPALTLFILKSSVGLAQKNDDTLSWKLVAPENAPRGYRYFLPKDSLEQRCRWISSPGVNDLEKQSRKRGEVRHKVFIAARHADCSVNVRYRDRFNQPASEQIHFRVEFACDKPVQDVTFVESSPTALQEQKESRLRDSMVVAANAFESFRWEALKEHECHPRSRLIPLRQ